MTRSLNESLPNIFVAGCSWARGEWQKIPPKVTHRGIMQYFEDDGYTVVDVTQARSSNSRVIKSLEEKLDKYYKEGDIVIFINADPVLDLIMPELAELNLKRNPTVSGLPKFSKYILEAGGLDNLIDQTQHNNYIELDCLAQKFNTHIHCIGSTFNNNTTLIEKFPTLNNLVMSWVYLLVGHFAEYEFINNPKFGISHTWELAYIDLSLYTPEFAEQVSAEFAPYKKNFYILEEGIFHPDGLHPNREGHKILYDRITQLLNL